MNQEGNLNPRELSDRARAEPRRGQRRDEAAHAAADQEVGSDPFVLEHLERPDVREPSRGAPA